MFTLAAPALNGCYLDFRSTARDAQADQLDARADVRTDGRDVPISMEDEARSDVVDAVSETALTDSATDSPTDAPTCALPRINEIQTGSTTGDADEFVELHNSSSCDLSLDGWTLRYLSAGGTSAATVWTGVSGNSVPAGGYVVVAGVTFTGTAIGRFVIGGAAGVFTPTGGGIALFGPPPAAARVDSVGYGTATNSFVEAMTASAPGTGLTIGRIPDGADTNDNQADFQALAMPSPNASNSP